MAQINRYTGNYPAFASNAGTNERTVFGSTTQSDELDDNINADYLAGWLSLVDANSFPTGQDFSALGFTLSQTLSYLHQAGVPDWDGAQQYFVNSYAKGSDGQLYRSLTGTTGSPNTGNNPVGDIVNWIIATGGSSFVDLTTDQTIDGIKTFTSFPVTPSSAPTTNFQVANKQYVDNNALNPNRELLTTINFASDANLTLDSSQNEFGNVTLTDTGVLLTAAREIIVSDDVRVIVIRNETAQNLTVKTSAGTGILVHANMYDILYVDGTNVVIHPSSSVGVNQVWQNLTGSRTDGIIYTNNTGKAITILITVNSNQFRLWEFQVNAVTVATYRGTTFNGDQFSSATIVIPVEATYGCINDSVGTGNIINWQELK